MIFLLFSRLLVILQLNMFTIIQKELRQFFSGLLGYLTIGVFLLITGILLFIIPESGILDAGYASMDSFFAISPYIMLFLIPAITMKSFSDEYRNGTFEILKTSPLPIRDLVLGKFFAAMALVLITLLCTLVYVYSLAALSTDGIDTGGIAGAYIGLFLLCGIYVAIGLFTSSMQQNAVTAFLLSAFLCYVAYALFSSLATIEAWKTLGYYISLIGIKHHFENVSRGFIDSRDLVYFLSVIALFIYLTITKIKINK